MIMNVSSNVPYGASATLGAGVTGGASSSSVVGATVLSGTTLETRCAAIVGVRLLRRVPTVDDVL